MLDGMPRIQERLDAVEQGRFARRRQSRQQRRNTPQRSASEPSNDDSKESLKTELQDEDHCVDLRI